MKYALITGGSRGIGAAAARLFARRGWGVAVGYCRSGEKAQALAEELSGLGVPAHICDILPALPAVYSVIDNCGNDQRYKKLKPCFQKLKKRS